MNVTRWRLYHQLTATGLPLEGGSGGRTKKQRTEQHLPKEHYYDALCVGASTPERFLNLTSYVQVWVAKGRGKRQLCRTNRYGFPVAHRTRTRQHFGFQTGDLVRADKPGGKDAGRWIGRVTTRADGRFVVTTADGYKFEVRHDHCQILQHQNGWQYTQKPRSLTKATAASSPP